MKFYAIKNNDNGKYFCGIQSWYLDEDINKARKFTQANWAKNCMSYHSSRRTKNCSVVKVECEDFKETII